VSGEYRPASRVRPGWHIRVENPPGSGEYVWSEVSWIADTTNYITGQKGRRFITVDGYQTSCLRSDDVMCRNRAEVREAAKDAGGAS
jgi:hypothetical protein